MQDSSGLGTDAGHLFKAGGHRVTQSRSLVRQLSGERVDHAVRQALDSAAVEWVESLDVEYAEDAAKSVLLVDDDAWVLRSLSRSLEAVGLRVLTAHGPMEGMALLSDPEVRVDLLVLDVMMPGLSGLTVARKASSLRPGMGILFISGRVILPEGDPHPEVTGPTRFLRKPLEADLFFKTVNEMLDTPASVDRRAPDGSASRIVQAAVTQSRRRLRIEWPDEP